MGYRIINGTVETMITAYFSRFARCRFRRYCSVLMRVASVESCSALERIFRRKRARGHFSWELFR